MGGTPKEGRILSSSIKKVESSIEKVESYVRTESRGAQESAYCENC